MKGQETLSAHIIFDSVLMLFSQNYPNYSKLVESAVNRCSGKIKTSVDGSVLVISVLKCCKRTVLVQLIVEDVVTSFTCFWNTVHVTSVFSLRIFRAVTYFCDAGCQCQRKIRLQTDQQTIICYNFQIN